MQQYNDHSHQQPHINNHHRQRINRTPDSIGAVVTENNSSVNRASALVENPAQQLTGESSAITNSAAANVEERINQIQEYIRITSTLINSIQAEKVKELLFFIKIHLAREEKNQWFGLNNK